MAGAHGARFGNGPRGASLAVALAAVVVFSSVLVVSGRTSTLVVRGGGVAGGEVEVAPAFVPGPGVVDLGPLAAQAPLDVAVALASRDPGGLLAELTLSYTPGTPEYHHFLTSTQVADRFGATSAQYAAAIAYFQGHGLATTASPDRWWIGLHGPASAVASAFGTSFDSYRQGSREFYSHPTVARLPSGLPWAGALGLGNATPPRPSSGLAAAAPAPLAPACSFTSALAPCNVGSAYNFSALWAAGSNGTGARIGVVDTYDGSEPQGTLASDLATFARKYSLPVGSVSYLYPIPTTHNLNLTSTGWSFEEALDLEWVRAIAPGASIDMTFAPDPTTGLYGAVDWLVAHHAVDVLSLSWGENDVGAFNTYAQACPAACNATSDGTYALLHPVLAAAALEGIGVFVASGDCGAADGTGGNSTDYPASDPAATGVGGTDLNLTSGRYAGETAWSGNALGSRSPGCQNQGGSGGGYAPFGRPWWQVAPGLPTTGTYGSARGVPDVSIVGGQPSADVVYNGANITLHGTSMGAPMWAGLAAIADQVDGGPLGLLNPSLYAIARGSSAAAAFHDVRSGTNGYRAGPGWDPVTGIGSPNASALVPLLASASVAATNLSTNLAASPRFGATPLAVTFYPSATEGGLPAPVTAYDIAFGDGNATWTNASSVTHRFTYAGVFVARAVAFDAAGNSSVSPPVAVVAGGGTALNVTLTASNASPAVGAAVTFNVTLVGGTAPFDLTYTFGDGTYAFNQTTTQLTHVFGFPGAFCAGVVAQDAARPPDGGASGRVGLAVGGGTVPSCGNAPPLTASITPGRLAFDRPGDLPLAVAIAGGLPPYTTHLVSDDAYVTACQCGIFQASGPHTIRAFVNDSLSAGVVASTSVTVYPSIAASFTASATAGAAPLTVQFRASVGGGHNVSSASVQWSFGDGASGAGATASHTYATPGEFVALGRVGDAYGGNDSRAFLVDVVAAGPGNPIEINATIAPAVNVPAGSPIAFTASATGGAGNLTYRWDLGANDSAYGPNVTQAYAPTGCLAAGTCPLNATLTVTDALGATAVAAFALPHPQDRRATALLFSDAVPGTVGATPYLLAASASVSGMAGAAVAWEFGDGGVASGTSVSHQYLVPGNFTIVVTATDTAGDRLVRTHAVSVSGPPRAAPTVTGGPNVTEGLAPLPVGFAASASGGAGGPYAYGWAFGDGATTTGAFANHTYPAPGSYAANLTVTDRIGTRTIDRFAIAVYNVTPVDLAFGPVANATRVGIGSTVDGSLTVLPTCTVASVPGCGPAAVGVELGWASVGGAVNVSVAVGHATSTGRFDFSVPGPTAAGTYVLYALAVGPNFTGYAAVPVTVLAAGASAPPLAPAWFLGVGLIAAAAVGIGGYVLVRRRRRRPDADLPASP